MRILLVEDDYLEEGLLRKILTGRMFKIPNEEIVTITTESEFLGADQGHSSIHSASGVSHHRCHDSMDYPKVAELDMTQVPEAVKKDGPYRAGVRRKMLDQLNPNIPILFYTILDRKDLDTDLFLRRGPDRTVEHVKKGADLDYARKDQDDDPLKEKLRHFLLGSRA